MVRYIVFPLVFIASCTSSPNSSIEESRSPIFYGESDDEHPGVVRLVGATGLCSGAFIARRVILTAHHCLVGTLGSSWEIMEGGNPPLAPLIHGREVVLPEHVGTTIAEDIAILVTAGDARVEPYFPAIDLVEDVIDSEVTVVGYGLDERGSDNYRQQGDMTVANIDSLSLLLVGQTWPGSGDSGGPIFDERGHIVGVVSRGSDGFAVIPRVDQHRWFIDPILREEGGCVIGDPEVCDGVDNDCDGDIDPECSQLGEACDVDEDCTGGECLGVAGEDICTFPCDPGDDEGCWEGSYCLQNSCDDGLCRPGEQGEGQLGDRCSDDLECESLICRDLGSESFQCTERCLIDGIDCPADNVCIGGDDECGFCAPASQTTSPRGLGEPCESDSECRDELACIEDRNHRYCSTPCDGSSCPPGMHCRHEISSCVRGELGDSGSPCVENDDCEEGLCFQPATSSTPYCTEGCGTGQSCGRRSSCDSELEVCIPWDALLGQVCGEEDDDLECIEGSECLTIDDEARCSATCGSFCPSGFECRELDSGDHGCWPLAAPAEDEGCHCRATGGAYSRSSPLERAFRDILWI